MRTAVLQTGHHALSAGALGIRSAIGGDIELRHRRTVTISRLKAHLRSAGTNRHRSNVRRWRRLVFHRERYRPANVSVWVTGGVLQCVAHREGSEHVLARSCLDGQPVRVNRSLPTVDAR